jgi:uncharacterized protein DUF3352
VGAALRPLLAALFAAVVLAGCGGGSAGGEGDPASAVPPDAVVYSELVVRPEGSLRDDARDAAGKVLRTDDPDGEIRRLVERLFEGEDFDYERDVEPWLGERAGFWLRPEDESGVLLLAATDTDAARESLEATLKRSGETVSERNYAGSDYLVSDGDAAGIVGDFVAIGPEAAYKRTVDAAAKDSLADTDEYADAVDALEDDRLAHFWVDTGALIRLGAQQDPDAAAQLDQLSAIVSLDDMPPIAGSFAADGDRLAVEVKVRGSGGALLGAGSTPLLQELPGDTWAALGAADVGESLRDTIDGLAGALGGIAVRRELQDQTGLDLDRDLLDWVGHVGVFVRGTTPATLDGGVVIQPTDEDRAADAVGRIVGAVQVKTKTRAQPVDVAGADQAFALSGGRALARPIVIARGSGLVVITAGKAAAEAALGSDDRLGDSDLYSEAQELVGMEPSVLVGMPQLLELVNASGPDPEFAEAAPYLEAYSVLAAGLVDDDGLVARFAAGLK